MEYMITAFILCMSLFIAWANLLKEKIEFNKCKFYILCSSCTIVTIINYNFPTDIFRMINSLIIFIVFSKLLFNKKSKDVILLGTFSLILMLVAEIIIVIIDQIGLKLLEVSNKDIIYVIYSNILTSFLLILFSKVPRIIKVYSNLVEATKKVSEKQVVFFSFFIAIVYNILALISYKTKYQELNIYYLSVASSILTIICCIIVYNYLKTQNQYLNIYEKYNISLTNIREYENILKKYKIDNHENKNQLLTIRSMSKNKKVISYIDILISNVIKDDELLLIEVGRIPSGGLQGLIYSKLLIMKNKKIKFELTVDKKIPSTKIRNINEELLTDICRIIGVFLDNAIEAVESLEEKYIFVEMYKTKKTFTISITNNYLGYINIDKISSPGYTTKSLGHGFGLTLVKEILEKNSNLENCQEIYEDNFMQTLKIKI